MAEGSDDLSMATLSLEDDDVHTDEELSAVRESVMTGDVERFLSIMRHQSPLKYLMDWLHTWQREYEAFMHVLDAQESATSDKESIDTDEELVEVEAEAEQLMKGFTKVVTALLQRYGVNDPDTVVDRHGWTLLMQAANSGLYELIEELVARKADVNYVKDNLNPLYLAIESKHVAVALLLLENGAIASATKVVTTPSNCVDVEEENSVGIEDCALFQACRLGQVSVIKEMLALGVDINFALPLDGDRPLHVSVMFERHEIVQLLIESKAIELNALNAIGQTCLFGCSSVELVKMLVTKGVDPTIKDVDGETALSMAQALDDDEVATFLETVT